MDNNKLIFSYDNFKNDSIKIYKDLIDENLKKSFDEISKKIDTEYKHNIGKNYNNTLYDYSEFNDIDIDGKKYNYEELKTFINNFMELHKVGCLVDGINRHKQNITQFFNFWENEKVVICHTYIDRIYRDSAYIDNVCYLMISNYGKIFNFDKGDTYYMETNFWIPLDYIFIIKEILKVYTRLPPSGLFTPVTNRIYFDIAGDVSKLLLTIKNKYFNRINLLEENNKLKIRGSDLEQENIKIKKHNNDLEQDKIDLLEENNKLKIHGNNIEQDKIDLLKQLESNNNTLTNLELEKKASVKKKSLLSSMNKQIDELKNYVSILEKQMKNYKSKNNDLEQDKIDLLEENKKIKKQNNYFRFVYFISYIFLIILF